MLRAKARSASRACRRGHHVLLTDHLRLQTATDRDEVIMRAAASDPQAQRWLGWSARFLIPEHERDLLLALEPGCGLGRPGGRNHFLLAVDRAGGLAAGGAVLDARSLEVGGWLAPKFRARGLGAELFAAMAQFGHEHLGITTVRAAAEPANVASVGALLAAGFQPSQGPQTYRLPDGRIIPARWFSHDTEQPARCRLRP
jgi:RimJ/RimL family protein N-acetyltransferase